MKSETIDMLVAGFISLFLTTGLIVVLCVVFANKRVDGYYLSRASGSTEATCVYAHWTWHVDEVAFCTDDSDKALDFVTRANASVK